jgi:hypothetical protein
MTDTVDFPQTRAALEAFASAFSITQKLGGQPPQDRPRERSHWRRLHRETDAARFVVERRYADELLPTVLGGEWQLTKARLSVPSHQRYYAHAVADHNRVLFDHPLHFRRRGTVGSLTWKSGAIVGLPYSVFSDHGHDDVLAGARAEATAITETYGAGVWARRDLSALYPGWTALVIAACDLPDDPERFGFIALAVPPAGDMEGSRQ